MRLTRGLAEIMAGATSKCGKGVLVVTTVVKATATIRRAAMETKGIIRGVVDTIPLDHPKDSPRVTTAISNRTGAITSVPRNSNSNNNSSTR